MFKKITALALAIFMLMSLVIIPVNAYEEPVYDEYYDEDSYYYDEYYKNREGYNEDHEYSYSVMLHGADAPYDKIKYIFVHINGEDLPYDGDDLVLPELVGDRVYVPLRKISEAVGATVEWDEATQSASVTRFDKTVVLTYGSTEAKVIENGNTTVSTLETAPYEKEDTFMVPVRFLSENLDLVVEWQEGYVSYVNIYDFESLFRKMESNPVYKKILEYQKINNFNEFTYDMDFYADFKFGIIAKSNVNIKGDFKFNDDALELNMNANTDGLANLIYGIRPPKEDSNIFLNAFVAEDGMTFKTNILDIASSNMDKETNLGNEWIYASAEEMGDNNPYTMLKTMLSSNQSSMDSLREMVKMEESKILLYHSMKQTADMIDWMYNPAYWTFEEKDGNLTYTFKMSEEDIKKYISEFVESFGFFLDSQTKSSAEFWLNNIDVSFEMNGVMTRDGKNSASVKASAEINNVEWIKELRALITTEEKSEEKEVEIEIPKPTMTLEDLSKAMNNNYYF